MDKIKRIAPVTGVLGFFLAVLGLIVKGWLGDPTSVIILEILGGVVILFWVSWVSWSISRLLQIASRTSLPHAAQYLPATLFDLADVQNILDDLRVKEEGAWDKEKNRHVGTPAKGRLTVLANNVLNIQRENKEGRFQVWIQKYRTGTDMLPKNPGTEGKRKIRVRFEAKILGAEHTLECAFYNQQSRKVQHREPARVSEDHFKPFSFVFELSPGADYQFRIVDCELSAAPSSVQIRNLVLSEVI